jgi:hypothetical protein
MQGLGQLSFKLHFRNIYGPKEWRQAGAPWSLGFHITPPHGLRQLAAAGTYAQLVKGEMSQGRGNLTSVSLEQVKEETLVEVFNMGGKNKIDSSRDLLGIWW